MEKRKRLPVGVDHFKKIRQQGFYYIDKTNLIKELITNWGEVNLFTRPRRFGKSLIMSMLQSFFEIGCDKTLFDGLNISRDKEFCEEYEQYIKLGTITDKNLYYVLDTIYNFSVIGYQNRFHPDHCYFKYLHTNMTYNRDESIVLHRGLLKALQIF